jgi:hypothetical protein
MMSGVDGYTVAIYISCGQKSPGLVTADTDTSFNLNVSRPIGTNVIYYQLDKPIFMLNRKQLLKQVWPGKDVL